MLISNPEDCTIYMLLHSFEHILFTKTGRGITHDDAFIWHRFYHLNSVSSHLSVKTTVLQHVSAVYQWNKCVHVCSTRHPLLLKKQNQSKQHYFLTLKSVSHNNWCTQDTFKQDSYSTMGGVGRCRVGEVRASTAFPAQDFLHNMKLLTAHQRQEMCSQFV